MPNINTPNDPKGHALRNLSIFIGIIFVLALLVQVFNSHVVPTTVSLLVAQWGYNNLVEAIAGWLPWAILPALIAVLAYRRDKIKSTSAKMSNGEKYFWWAAISAMSALLIIIMTTTVPSLGNHGNDLSLSPQVARFLKTPYYISSFIISMTWTLVGWFLLIRLDSWTHKFSAGKKEWSMAWIFSMVPILSLTTVLFATIFGLTYLIAIWGVPLIFGASRTGYILSRGFKKVTKKPR